MTSARSFSLVRVLQALSSRPLTLVLLPAAVLTVDQVGKTLALRHLLPGVPIHLIDGLVALRLGFNPGLAFGLLAGLDDAWRWVVSLLSIAALMVVARIAFRITAATGAAPRIAVGLVFGGALGNVVDRARHGAVVDFIDLHWRGYHWPAFNAADSAITVGVLLLASTLMKDESRSRAAD